MDKKTNKKTKISEQEAQKALDANKKEAEVLLNDEKKMDDFLTQLENKFNSVTGIGKKLADSPLIVSLIRSYMKKEYTEIPLGTIIGLVASLIYFLSPVDLIPDVIPGLGYVDDITVIAIALRFAYTDIEDYKKWLAKQEDGE